MVLKSKTFLTVISLLAVTAMLIGAAQMSKRSFTLTPPQPSVAAVAAPIDSGDVLGEESVASPMDGIYINPFSQ